MHEDCGSSRGLGSNEPNRWGQPDPWDNAIRPLERIWISQLAVAYAPQIIPLAFHV